MSSLGAHLSGLRGKTGLQYLHEQFAAWALHGSCRSVEYFNTCSLPAGDAIVVTIVRQALRLHRPRLGARRPARRHPFTPDGVLAARCRTPSLTPLEVRELVDTPISVRFAELCLDLCRRLRRAVPEHKVCAVRKDDAMRFRVQNALG